MNQKIVLGFSGGADSTAAALLLQEKGFEVVTVTLDFTGDQTLLKIAEQQARKLGCEHRTVDVRDRFQTQVIKPFIEAYRRGETPNPCLICDAQVKLQALAEAADTLQIEAIATGHYLRLEREADSSVHVFRSAAVRKDQSYYFYPLSQSLLKRLQMPLSDFSDKTQVRAYLKMKGFDFEAKDESQGICFVSGDLRGFLKARLPELPEGHFVNRKGEILGTHPGFYHYTIGQFRGISLDRKYVVTGFYPLKNEVVLGEEADLYQDRIILRDLHFINEINDLSEAVSFRICRWGYDLKGILKLQANGAGIIIPKSPVRAPTPGQAAVFYRGDELLGGGIIVNPADAHIDFTA